MSNGNVDFDISSLIAYLFREELLLRAVRCRIVWRRKYENIILNRAINTSKSLRDGGSDAYARMLTQFLIQKCFIDQMLVQPSTVDEHLKVLLNDEDTIDYDPSEVLSSTDLPEWYDDELFQAGTDYYSSNLLGISMASLAGLIAVLSIPSILKVLIHTKQSGTPCTAFKRYFETLLHTRAWYTKDSKDKSSDWYKTTNVVRWKHDIANRRSLREGLGGITHRDMAFTQFGFIAYVLLKPEYLGLTNTRKQREGINHLWRVVGHMIGITDRLNLCRETEAETSELCKKIHAQVFTKYFKQLPPNFVEMSETMLDGMWCIDLATDKDAVMAFAYKLQDLPYYKPLSLYSWLNLKYRETIHWLCAAPYVGTIVRVYFNYFLNFNYRLQKKWPVCAWLAFGKENCTIQLYPKLK